MLYIIFVFVFLTVWRKDFVWNVGLQPGKRHHGERNPGLGVRHGEHRHRHVSVSHYSVCVRTFRWWWNRNTLSTISHVRSQWFSVCFWCTLVHSFIILNPSHMALDNHTQRLLWLQSFYTARLIALVLYRMRLDDWADCSILVLTSEQWRAGVNLLIILSPCR